ncbi:hypothetical protein [Roseibium marinum]|uniref:Uncharacterized protein n=1 Tax=Roseibium marinum TaxID=281252 RepID=A0A2S3UVW3_9HYPH|nr:hypothetical protein [Roseibium marinum]POF31693.1 hypothetical protein CLV41_104263 [Roseibium marinum]
MTDFELSDFESPLFHQLIGCSLLLVVLFGLAHNVFLSVGDPFSGNLPSTHPVTAAGFLVLACAILFRPEWDSSVWIRGGLSWIFIALCVLRILEALYPSHLSAFTGGHIVVALETVGLYGRFSVETALFLLCCFAYELAPERQMAVKLLAVSCSLAVLSLGLIETAYSFFLWGNGLSLITQVAMILVCLDLIYRLRDQLPFHSVFRTARSSFYFQFTVLALYLLPIIMGAVLLHKFEISPAFRTPFEFAFAGTSWLLLCLALVLGLYLDNRKHEQGFVRLRDQGNLPDRVSRGNDGLHGFDHIP